MSRRYYAEIHLHFTWHTKESAPLLVPKVEAIAHHAIRGKCMNRLQEGGVGDLVVVREGAAAQLGDAQVPLRLAGLAEVLEGAQAPQGGVEEGQQMGQDDIVGLGAPMSSV